MWSGATNNGYIGAYHPSSTMTTKMYGWSISFFSFPASGKGRCLTGRPEPGGTAPSLAFSAAIFCSEVPSESAVAKDGCPLRSDIAELEPGGRQARNSQLGFSSITP